MNKKISGLVSNNDVGLAVSQSLMLTGYLQWGMRQSADVANQMMSVERVLEYMEIKPETNLEVCKFYFLNNFSILVLTFHFLLSI